MSKLRLQVSITDPSPTLLMVGQGFIVSLNNWLQKNKGGACHGLATDTAITAEISGVSREEVMPLLDSFALKMSRSLAGLQVVVTDVVAEPLTIEQKELAASFNIPPRKLTLRFFETLPVGYFVASNLLTASNTPVFAEVVATLESRMEQWKRIQKSGAAQRMCHVFRSEEAFNRWLAGWPV